MDTRVGQAFAWVAIHQGFRNKERPRFASGREDGWRNVEWTLDALLDHISLGMAWVGCHLSGDTRSQDTAGPATLLVLDIDGQGDDPSLEAFWANPIAQRHCFATITSCSHQKEGRDRFRAIFRIGEHQGQDLHWALHRLLLGQLGFDLADHHGHNLEDAWYGNDQAIIQRNAAATDLPWDWLDVAAAELKAEQERWERIRSQRQSQGDGAKDLERCAFVLRTPGWIRDDGEGEGQRWSKVFAAAVGTQSEEVWQAFVVWHGRSSSPTRSRMNGTRLEKRRQRLKSRRITADNAVEVLLGQAKATRGQGWARELPPELRYAPPQALPPVFAQAPPLTQAVPTAERALAAAQSRAPDHGGPIVLSFGNSTPITPASPPSKRERNQLPHVVAGMRRDLESESFDVLREGAEDIKRLLQLIYHLRVSLIHRLPDGDRALEEDEAQFLIDRYTSELLTYPVYQRSPEKIELRLLEIFRQEHNIVPTSDRNLRVEKLFDDADQDPEPLLPALMAKGCSYVLYAKQGAGKSILALLLARAAVAAPTYNRFLDFGEVPLEHWQQRRALYVASDGGVQSKADLRRYARNMKQDGEAWLEQSLDVLAATHANRAKRWRIELYHLHRLSELLDQAAAEGRPYALVVIDSLKAVAPPGVRVSQQEIVDFVELVDAICHARGATVLYVHHQSKEGDTAQGAAGLLEMVHGVFRIKLDENGQRQFCVEKTRLDIRGNRQIPYRITANGHLEILSASEQEDDDGAGVLLKALTLHYEEHCTKVAHLEQHDPARSYQGVRSADLFLLLRRYDLRDPNLTNARRAQELGRELVHRKLLQRLELQGQPLALANINLKPGSESIQHDLPGWD